MYTKIYDIKCDPAQADALMAYYDDVVAGVTRDSASHIGHQMVETGPGTWLLVSNYVSKEAAIEFGPRVKEIVAPLVADYGMEISVLSEGETVKNIT